MSNPTDPKSQRDVRTILASGAATAADTFGDTRLKWALPVGGGLLLLAVIWAFSGRTANVRYITDEVQRGSIIVIVTATGSVQPTKKVDVSSELSGTIRKVHVDYNSLVKAGQPLAELDTDKLTAAAESSRAKFAASKAKVADAEATVLEKNRELARKQSLADKQFASTHDLDVALAARDRAIAALAVAKADVGVAAADVTLSETNLAKAVIASPISGVVLKRSVDPGQTVASSLQAPVLFSIAEDLKQMELQVDVDEADVGKVKIGQVATFGVDAFPERKFPATIRDVRFASETIQGVVTYKAVLNIDNSELLLRPGMTATAEIKVTEVMDVLTVSNAALRYMPPQANTDQRSFLKRLMPGIPQFRPASPREESGPNRTLWVFKTGTPVAVKAVIGASDGKRTEIRSGEIKAGDALVIDQSTTAQK